MRIFNATASERKSACGWTLESLRTCTRFLWFTVNPQAQLTPDFQNGKISPGLWWCRKTLQAQEASKH